MKKILLDAALPYYKANLHCHSVISDGTKTPEEIKEMYMREGYSIVAYTDHNVLIDHSDLTDDKFLALNGYEVDTAQECTFKFAKTCHLCFIALAHDNLKQVCFHRSFYYFGNAAKYKHLLKFDESKPDFVRSYTPECINKMISEGRENGFFVTYNHPAWSLESYNEYSKYHGMNAMEICNYGCFESGHIDYNEKEYDDILRGGEKIYCISTDDNHNYREDSFGGFTVINAEKLEYETITGALTDGKFYASQGPGINSLWYEDGKIGIECTAASSIRLNTATRRTQIFYSENSDGIKSAVFDVEPDDVYVRITVTDFSGKHANTSAYFVDDLM